MNSHRYSVSSMASANSASQHQLDHIIPRSSSVSEMLDIDDKFIRKPKAKPVYNQMNRNSRNYTAAAEGFTTSTSQLAHHRQQSRNQGQNTRSHRSHSQRRQQSYQQYPQYQQYQQYPQQQQQQYPNAYPQNSQQYQQYQQYQQQYPQYQQYQQTRPQQQRQQQQQQQYPQTQKQPQPYQEYQQYPQQQQNMQQMNPNQKRKTVPRMDSRLKQYAHSKSQPPSQQNQYQLRPHQPTRSTSGFYINPQAPSSNLNIPTQASGSASNLAMCSANRSFYPPANRPHTTPTSFNSYHPNSNGGAFNSSSNSAPNSGANSNPNSNSNSNPTLNLNTLEIPNAVTSSSNTNTNTNSSRGQTPGKSSPSTTNTTTSESSSSINRTPVKQSLSNSKNNIVSPLTDFSSAEGLDDTSAISQTPQTHTNPTQFHAQQKQKNIGYNHAAIAAKAAVRNVPTNAAASLVKPIPTQTSAYRTPATTDISNLTPVPRATPVPENIQSSPRSEQKKGFFRRIFSRPKSTKDVSPVDRSPVSSPKDSKFSLRRLSLIRSSSRNSTSTDRSQSTSRASSIDARGMKIPSTSSRSSLKINKNPAIGVSNKEAEVFSTGIPDHKNSTPPNPNNTRIFSPVTEATEVDSSYNTLSNTDLPLSNRTISDFNSGETENYNYMTDLKTPLSNKNNESAKHSLVALKSNNSSFFSANEDMNKASNRITQEKNDTHQLLKVKTAETSDLSETDDFDTSMASISKIDSSVAKKQGCDHVVLELGYLSTIVGLGETNFFNSELKRSNTNRSATTNVTTSTGKSNTEKDEHGTMKLSVPTNDTKSVVKKSSWGSIRAKDERKKMVRKLGRKIPFARLRERFDISFDDDDTNSHHTGHESDAESASYVNRSILDDDDDDTDFELHSGLDYDGEFFQNLKTKHILPANYEPRHGEILADSLKGCMKDEEDESHLFHSKRVDVGFIDDAQYGVTFSNEIYDRSNPDMKKVYVMMTYYPREIRAIRIELNEFKKNEMVVNDGSKQYTHTFEV